MADLVTHIHIAFFLSNAFRYEKLLYSKPKILISFYHQYFLLLIIYYIVIILYRQLYVLKSKFKRISNK